MSIGHQFKTFTRASYAQQRQPLAIHRYKRHGPFTLVYCTPVHLMHLSSEIYTSLATTTATQHHDRDLNATDYVRVTTRSTNPMAALLAQAPELVPAFTNVRLLSSLARKEQASWNDLG